MKKYFFLFFLLIFCFSYSQQGTNIDLDEVVNTAGQIPRIVIENSIYSFRKRDALIRNLLVSPFWRNYKFNIPLEDYDTGETYSFISDGPVKVFINNIELNERHLFKNLKTIKELNRNILRVEIRKIEQKTALPQTDNLLKSTEYKLIGDVLPNGQRIVDGIATITPPKTDIDTKKPITTFIITAKLDPKTVYNRTPSSRRNIREKVNKDQAGSIALEGVEVVKSVEKDGIVYAPKYIDGQLVFEKNNKLTELARKAKRFKEMGFNEWGIDVNATTWGVALRGHIKGPISPDGLPILMPGMSINNQAKPLWIVDGVYLEEPPAGVTSLSPLIREVKVLKYSDAAFYGSRGANGVIIINTTVGITEGLNAKRSFNVKGRKNRELITKYLEFENKFNTRVNLLKSEKKYAYENKNVIRMDSFQNLLDQLLLKSYLYTANFAIINSDYEVAPYLAFTRISDANIILLDSIANTLSKKVKKSNYGKKFISLVEKKKENNEKKLNETN